MPPISQGRTAAASSTYSAACDAAKAVDGDTSSRWAQQSGAADPSWLKVDLGADYQISSTNTTAYLPSGLGMKYKIETSADNSTWTMYADKTTSYSTPGVDTNAGTVIARYVRITLTATQGQGGSFYEFQVYGDPVSELAQGKTAAASSTYSGTYSAAKAVDGDAATRWAQASGAPDPSWLKVDLGAAHTISGVNTTAYLPAGQGIKYRIEYSTDDTTWSMYDDNTATFSIPGFDTTTAPVTARYVRVTLTATQGQGGSLYELKVYGN